MSQPPVVEAHNIGRRFGTLAALGGVELAIQAGETVALLGPNGAGKSTLLRVIAGLLKPTSGRLRLFGTEVSTASAALRQRVGMISHQTFLYSDLSPIENLEFYARLYGIPDATERIPMLIERTGLTGWAHRPVRTLSRGLEQRCAIARAVLHRPSLLLLDEPFTGLDRGASAVLGTMIEEFRAGGGGVMMSTHDLDRALDLCQRIYLLRRGRVFWHGPNDHPNRAAFEQAYEAAFA